MPLALELADSCDDNDPIQSVVAHEIAALHAAGMQALGRGLSDWDRAGAVAMLNAANRCFSKVAKLSEAVTRRQNKAEQRVVIKRVNVNDGGQAVIGDVQGVGVRGNPGGRPMKKQR